MKKRPLFNRAKLVESTSELKNPARGWYRIYSFRVECEPNVEELKWCLDENETCVLVILDIGAYRSRDLDGAALENIRRILKFFDENKKDIILRTVYDTEGKATEHEPSVFSQVTAHITQLGGIIREYDKRILLYEGMLVGNWGEMHGSRFLAKKYMALLNETMEQNLPGIMRAVRRPSQWRMLHHEPPHDGTMMGLYNDAIFGSDTDLGTFAAVDVGDGGWEDPWGMERELEFEKQLSAFVPQCGEAVCGITYGSETLLSTTERLRRMGLSYLNGVYDEKILRIWREWTWNEPDEWRGMNGFDYIGRHLGYRFCVRSAQLLRNADLCDVVLNIENVGFSGFYQEAEVSLIIKDIDGQETEYLTDWDIREWKSGQTVSLLWRVHCREGQLLLSARRKWDRETIRFANLSTEQGQVLLGEWKR